MRSNKKIKVQTRIKYHPTDHRFTLHMCARTGDDLAWREYMKRVHGGFTVDLKDGREHCLGKDPTRTFRLNKPDRYNGPSY